MLCDIQRIQLYVHICIITLWGTPANMIISFFTLYNFFCIILYYCRHIKRFDKTIKSPCLLGRDFRH